MTLHAIFRSRPWLHIARKYRVHHLTSLGMNYLNHRSTSTVDDTQCRIVRQRKKDQSTGDAVEPRNGSQV